MAIPAIEVQLPPLHTLQREVADSPARFRVLCCGRRWGKTRLAIIIAMREMLENAGAVLWVAPSHDKTNIGWRIAQKLVRQIPLLSIRASEKRIEAPNGGWIQFRSADSQGGLRGEGLTLVIVDEAAHIRNLEDIWTQELRPALSDREGRAVFISTPRGYNYFHALWQNGLDGGDWQSWQYPTSTNPKINPAEIESARLELPELIFRQEYLAEFIRDEGAVFRRVQDAAVLTPIAEPIAGHQYVIGVDVAASVDYTVIAVGDVNERACVYLDRFNRVDYGVLIDRIQAIYNRYNCSLAKIESNSIGQPVIDELYRRGMNIIPFLTTGATKQIIIQNLQAAFEQSKIRIIEDKILIGELLSYESKRNPSGSITYSAPPGAHDDCVMALALMWDCMNTGAVVIEENPFYT